MIRVGKKNIVSHWAIPISDGRSTIREEVKKYTPLYFIKLEL